MCTLRQTAAARGRTGAWHRRCAACSSSAHRCPRPLASAPCSATAGALPADGLGARAAFPAAVAVAVVVAAVVVAVAVAVAVAAVVVFVVVVVVVVAVSY